MDKTLLINAIIGKGFKSMEDADRYTRIGLAVFTGNQWNPEWEWSRTALEMLDEQQLAELYAAI